MTNYSALPEFDRELKKLTKKYKSLPDDLELFKKILAVSPEGNERHFACLTKTDAFVVIKARLFCQYLKGSSLRIIYAYWKVNDCVELIELYFKGDKETEDTACIKAYLKSKIQER